MQIYSLQQNQRQSLEMHRYNPDLCILFLIQTKHDSFEFALPKSTSDSYD